MNLKKQILITALLLCFTIVLFGTTNIDLWIQDHFFDPSTQKWILDKNLEPYHTLFYTGIKKMLIVIAVTFLLVYIFLRNRKTFMAYKKGLLIVILSAIFVPLFTGALKKATNMPCPKHEIHYGGEYPRTAVWESYAPTLKKKERIACWPAGHASGGFALMSLFFLFKSIRNRYIALFIAITVGWIMGLYKMLIGDHFFSHTLITMLLAWLIILTISFFIYRKQAKIP